MYNKEAVRRVRNELYASSILMEKSIASGIPVGIGEVDTIRNAVFAIEFLEDVIENLNARLRGNRGTFV